jgi:hypothetical protein
MWQDDPGKVIFLIVGIVVLSFVLLGSSYHMGKRTVRIEAVKNGTARWVSTISEDGEATVKFEWILPAEKKGGIR